tara:strand:+ start:181 stop:696 length:516 start_codon:yes stop_codon:yes gene_type:complete
MSRQKDDWYPTPTDATESFLDVEKFEGSVWEPACGDGAISKVLEAHGMDVTSNDLNDFGYGQSNIDFLMEVRKEADNIISNPPYKLASDFISKAIDLSVGKHAWLLRLSFLEGIARHTRIYQNFPPARIWVFKRRLTIWRGDEEITGSGTTAYAWFVWERGNYQETKIGWI